MCANRRASPVDTHALHDAHVGTKYSLVACTASQHVLETLLKKWAYTVCDHHAVMAAGEIGDTWVFGVASDPLKTANFRAASRLRAACIEDPACPSEVCAEPWWHEITDVKHCGSPVLHNPAHHFLQTLDVCAGSLHARFSNSKMFARHSK